MIQDERKRTRVVVVGGGFGGLQVARALAGRRDVELSLVDRENHHLFQPLLYQVATAGLSPDEIAVPIRAVLKGVAHTEVFLEEVESVTLAKRAVTLRSGRMLPYDYLVLAAGARTNYLGHDEWAEHAYGLKDLRDALRLKERILLTFEEAEHETDHERRRTLLTFVIVGGGPTGVELAGAVAELARSVLRQDFRHVAADDIQVVLVEMMDRLLAPFEPGLSERAKRALQLRGVDLRLGARVSQLGPGWVELDGERIACGLVCWAPGVKPVPLGERLGVPTHKGRVLVDATCSVPGYPEVFVIGDMAAQKLSPASDQEAFLPGLAAVAMQQGKYVGRLIEKELAGARRAPFRYRDRGIMATVGRAYALAQTKHLRMSGLVAWLAWIFVHVYLMIGYRNRFLVLYEWFWAYLTMKRGSRILTRRDAALAGEGAPELPGEPKDAQHVAQSGTHQKPRPGLAEVRKRIS